MDSISQAALGAAVAGVVAGKRCSPKVLLAGAILGTLPDLDVLLDYGDPLSNMIKHRGFSHSIFTLLPFSVLLTVLGKRFIAKEWPFWQLFTLILLALVTHPILDSFTSYGTQIFWPLALPPVSISSIFIIDPLYTLPLLICVLAGLSWSPRATKLCALGLLLSSLYLIWSLVALGIIKDRIENNVAGTTLDGLPVFIAPTAFNTVLWRVVLLDDETYWEGLISLLDDSPAIKWLPMNRGKWPLPSQPQLLDDFDHFTSGFVGYQQQGKELIVTDLRLGMAMYHPFSFVMAVQNEEGRWEMQDPQRRHSDFVLPQIISPFWFRLLGAQNVDAMLCNKKDCSQN